MRVGSSVFVCVQLCVTVCDCFHLVASMYLSVRLCAYMCVCVRLCATVLV